MLEELLPKDIFFALSNVIDIDKLEEIRLRVDKPIRYMINGKFFTLYEDNSEFLARNSHINLVLSNATKRSMYAYNDQITKGFIAYDGGIRIGLAGEGVTESGHIVTMKNICYLTIRIPRQILGVADKLIANVPDDENILIISPPGGGKTTILRDYLRQISDKGYNCLLIDERGEVASSFNGKCMLDVGKNTDVISYVDKSIAYKMAIRSLNPMVLATDEVFGTTEIDAIKDIVRSGIKVVATVHAKSFEELRNSAYREFASLFHYIVTIYKDTENRFVEVKRYE